jgi:predicted acetyltransferase
VNGPELVTPVPVEDARDWLAALATTLLGTPYDADFDRRVDRWSREWLPDRVWGYREHGRWVATLATEPHVLTVPGPNGGTLDLVADALTGVTVAATHRRRGLLTSMIGRSLQAAKDRGDAVSILVAAEWPIYGRFGYAPAVTGMGYTYHPRRPNAALPPPPPGSVRQVEPAELRDVAPAVFDAARRHRAGQIDRSQDWWDRRLAVNGYEPIGKRPNWFVHEGPDGPDGVLAWKVSRDFELTGEMGAVEVDEFVAATDAAYRDFWSYLAGIDVVGEIVVDDRPVDEPIRWLLRDGRALAYKHTFDFVWVRILDVPAALSARAYAVPGRLVLEVVDEDLGGYAAGRYALEASETAAKCVPTDEPAELRLSERALAACYLGGHRLRSRAFAGDVEELAAGALDRADVMFSTSLAPWCQTGF